MAIILTGKALEQRCSELGIDIQGSPITHSSLGANPRASDYELQRRLIEAERSIRENRLWKVALVSALVALVSAIASIVSAGTALLALYMAR